MGKENVECETLIDLRICLPEARPGCFLVTL